MQRMIRKVMRYKQDVQFTCIERAGALIAYTYVEENAERVWYTCV
jgi:hypothetical protein